MPKGLPVFLVEGHLEHDFLEEICGKKKSRVLKIPNGKTVSPKVIARQVIAQVSMLAEEPSYVTVVADREQRAESAIDVENEIANELQQQGLMIPFSVHVPDKMIENWILADVNVLNGEGLSISLAVPAEGCHGKSVLDAAFRKKRSKYNERIDGVKLLKLCKASTVSSVSPSFQRLRLQLKNIFLGCHWIQR